MMLKRIGRFGYVASAWLFAAGVVAQVLFAGMALFVSNDYWNVHRGFGYGIGYLVPLFVLFALLGRVRGRTLRLLGLLVLVYFVQTFLPPLRTSVPVVAALHPVNALLVFSLGLAHARRSLQLVRPAKEPLFVAESPASDGAAEVVASESGAHSHDREAA